MEALNFPSPSTLLASPILKPALEPPPLKRKQTTATKPANSAKKPTGTVKPKQSKSRNGCTTCKAKRLKCDETHPACKQCHRRNVTCGGYKKDFKWRPFEETTFVNKPAPAKTKRASPIPKPDAIPPQTRSPSTDGLSTPGAEIEGDTSMADTEYSTIPPTPPPVPTFLPHSFPELNFADSPSSMFDMGTPPFLREFSRPRIDADSRADTITSSLESLFEDSNTIPPNTTTRPTFSGQSPRLIDLLQPGSELNTRPGTVTIPPLNMPTLAMEMSPIMDQNFQPQMDMTQNLHMENDVEEIIREPEDELWMSLRGPVRMGRSKSPSVHVDPIYRQPEIQAGSPEMLMLRFDKQTCGILSVKDGPTENPWRTMVWPLARDSPALYHAIASMTAFHTSKERPALRVEGMEHMRRSIRSLASGIAQMRTDTALATTLVLAFAESWDQHISTGIEHLRGARILINQALMSHRKQVTSGDDLVRLRFLCNTFVYMDVIARLTSASVETEDFETPTLPSINSQEEIDPLMGLASTLFPIIGRVANLCRKVCTISSNSIAIISQAIELKELIVQWSPPPFTNVSCPEDPTAEIQHALQTAEAYRYATLLYLHQAVPEIPSWTSAQLAKKVLIYLATVPLSSRLVIVQIYPLLAAGCEATEPEDRQWVEERWHAMVNRMWIGNIDRCWEVVQEVWSRRDEAEAIKSANVKKSVPTIMHSEISKRKLEEERLQDDFSFSDMLSGREKRPRTSGSFSGSPVGEMFAQRKRVHVAEDEDMERELTVRGRLHWVGVMKDWNWESRSLTGIENPHFQMVSLAS